MTRFWLLPNSATLGGLTRATQAASNPFGEQHHLSGCSAGFEVFMRLSSLGQRVAGADPDVQSAFRDPGEDVAGPLEQLLPGRGVVPDPRPRQEKGAAGLQ